MKTAFILAILLAPAVAYDRTCYRMGFVCDCATGICENGAVAPRKHHPAHRKPEWRT